MPTIRIATFNCENLFARYNFRENASAGNGFTINDLAFDILSTRAKRITASAIKATDADIICLQEVESLPVLDRFNSEFLGTSSNKRYNYRTLFDGNDPRAIDVAFLSRIPVKSMRSSRDIRSSNGRSKLFSRDCLRVDFEIGGEILSLYGNHFKSMMGGRKGTRDRRLEQAEGVHQIIHDDYGAELDGNVVVLGDLNDYREADQETTTALGALLDNNTLVDPMLRLDPEDQWTHYWSRKGHYRQLDYVFLSRKLDDASGNPVPERELRGMPWRADRVNEDRFDDVGQDNPKASDHAPVTVEINVGAPMV
ncbi:endonuclease/exonuclease/phosphatase family protein [Labrenzia sp. R5_0]|uniref:endonuclease/exonuclease/phosphatase family protein n=1 Tax=Labrenzia sp. R5_0 TaxID=2821108 RepID=UPI001ADBC728|nr:endonuclease/exonuclease/phosphatase family protein [Labrenzia sp. R5_0]MBO9462455.1 endonuclease/exonuclease/phosphatase family protein [Labrenzia sp. R5_0]